MVQLLRWNTLQTFIKKKKSHFVEGNHGVTYDADFNLYSYIDKYLLLQNRLCYKYLYVHTLN